MEPIKKTNKVNNFFTSNNKKPSDRKLAFAYLKSIDPQSTIREGELSMELIKNLVNKK